MAALIHLAGIPAHIDTHLRQRCAWCGAVIIDVDLATVAVQVREGEEPAPYPTWEVGGFVLIDGGVHATIEHVERLRDLPEASCLTLDPAATQ